MPFLLVSVCIDKSPYATEGRLINNQAAVHTSVLSTQILGAPRIVIEAIKKHPQSKAFLPFTVCFRIPFPSLPPPEFLVLVNILFEAIIKTRYKALFTAIHLGIKE